MAAVFFYEQIDRPDMILLSNILYWLFPLGYYCIGLQDTHKSSRPGIAVSSLSAYDAFRAELSLDSVIQEINLDGHSKERLFTGVCMVIRLNMAAQEERVQILYYCLFCFA